MGREKGAEMRYRSRWSLLLFFLKGSGRWFTAAILSVLSATFFELLSPKIISFTVDSILAPENGGTVLPGWPGLPGSPGGRDYFLTHPGAAAGLVVLTALLGAMFRYVFRVTNAMGAERLTKTMRDSLFSHIQKLPFRWFMENQTGDIIQRCTSDVESIKRFLSEELTSLVRILLMIALSVSFMSGIHVRLTLVAAAFVPIIILYAVLFHRKIGETFARADEEEGVLSTLAQENLTGVRVIRAFGRERAERDRFEQQNRIYTRAYMKLGILLSAFWSLGDFISGLQVMIIVTLGAYYTIRAEMSPGDYIAFVSYNAMLVWPVRSLGRIVSDMSKAGVSVDRILYIMNAEEERDLPGDLPCPAEGGIEFSHVSFRYTEDAPWLLRDLSFSVRQGETLGILGGTGSGKTTILYLLDRLYELPEENGTIRLGGVDIRTIRRDSLRQHIGLILQEPFLFSRSIRENIGITRLSGQAGVPEAQDSALGPAQDTELTEEIRQAAGLAALEETIAHFERGYDTPVGERGVTLSGGQKQRVAIAQTILRDTPVLVLDDSLSAVDTETDAQIRASLREVRKNTTTILISHRIQTLREADRILVLSQGQAAELGTHEELYALNGIYRMICDIQNGGTGQSAS